MRASLKTNVCLFSPAEHDELAEKQFRIGFFLFYYSIKILRFLCFQRDSLNYFYYKNKILWRV
jgi:hypothetical protein